MGALLHGSNLSIQSDVLSFQIRAHLFRTVMASNRHNNCCPVSWCSATPALVQVTGHHGSRINKICETPTLQHFFSTVSQIFNHKHALWPNNVYKTVDVSVSWITNKAAVQGDSTKNFLFMDCFEASVHNKITALSIPLNFTLHSTCTSHLSPYYINQCAEFNSIPRDPNLDNPVYPSIDSSPQFISATALELCQPLLLPPKFAYTDHSLGFFSRSASFMTSPRFCLQTLACLHKVADIMFSMIWQVTNVFTDLWFIACNWSRDKQPVTDISAACSAPHLA